MKRFVQGADRTQSILLPEQLKDYVNEDNRSPILRLYSRLPLFADVDGTLLAIRKKLTIECQLSKIRINAADLE